MVRRRLFGMACFTAILLALLTSAEKPAPAPPIVIVGVTVVDTRGGPSLTGRTVVIHNGIIANILADENYSPASPDATVIDGRGKFLIPGLWDMHVHCVREGNLALNLANGVTGLRIMWGSPAMAGFPVPHAAWKRDIEAGKRIGPRLVVASNILDGPKPIWPTTVAIRDADEARKAVRDAKAAGADFIKVYSMLTPEGYRAVAAESKALGIAFAGHVPTLLSASEASDLGQKSMEHLYGIFAACTPDEAGLLKQRQAILDDAKGDWATARIKLRPIDEKVRDSYNPDRGDALFARLKANTTWQCPTLVVLKALAYLDDAAFLSDPRLIYIDSFTKLYWDPKNDFRLRNMKPEDFAAQKQMFERSLTLVGKMQKAGVPIIAGTDEGNPYIFSGFSLHDELGLLVQAGLTPAEALRAATLNPAKYLGREGSLGTVEVGKAADLVLLDADPLAEIGNTRKIRAVIARGRLFDRGTLDTMIKAAEHKPAFGTKPQTGPRPVGGLCPDH
jgi:imidazolonepropionase-like amidohydrolase